MGVNVKKFLLGFLVLAVFASAALAQTDTIILVSDTTHVDMLIAKAAGEKEGAGERTRGDEVHFVSPISSPAMSAAIRGGRTPGIAALILGLGCLDRECK